MWSSFFIFFLFNVSYNFLTELKFIERDSVSDIYNAKIKNLTGAIICILGKLSFAKLFYRILEYPGATIFIIKNF